MSLLISVLYGLAACLGAAFALMELRMLWRFVRHRREIRSGLQRSGGGPHRPPEALPTVTVQLPLYNERRAAEQIVRAAAGQRYPRDRFDVQVLDDSDDETVEIVADVVTELKREGVRIEHIRRGSRDGYKAGALATGLERSGAELVAVFDADFVPAPDFLHRIIVEKAAFADPRVAFAQARWAWNEPVRGVLASALALLLDRHFFVQKPTRAFVGNVTTFNGSGGIWRRAAIEGAGGWSAETLTEDLDLSYRCALGGWRGRYLQDIPVVNELPSHMRAFKQQQHRWARGNAQCFTSLTGRVMASRGVLRDRLDEAFLLAGYAIHPILLANLVLWPWAVLFMNRPAFLVIQGIMGLVVLVAPVSFALTVLERDGGWRASSVGQIIAGVCVGIGLMVNNTVGQIQGFLTSGGEFVRTPKFRHLGSEGPSKPRPAPPHYRTPLHWTFFVEMIVVCYCIAGAAMLVGAGEGLWAVPLLFWAACLGMVVGLQMEPAPA